MPPPYSPSRDRAFEIAVVERVVFHFDREPLVRRIERGPARDRPGLEHAIQLQPEVIVQPARGVLLDDEAQPLRWRHVTRAARLGGLC